MEFLRPAVRCRVPGPGQVEVQREVGSLQVRRMSASKRVAVVPASGHLVRARRRAESDVPPWGLTR